MSHKMLSFGDFIFDVYKDTDYETFTRTAESGQVTLDRAGQAPATQLTGQPLQTINLSGQILGNSGSQTLDQLRSLINGPPRIMLTGDGRNLGQWLLLRVTETGSRLIDNGSALKTRFSVDLREYRP